MKVLLITGLMAEETVKRYANKTKVAAEVLALKVPVAAFLSPELITTALKEVELETFDMILVPGLIRGDTKAISNSADIPVFKGPKYAADLPTILESLADTKLSTVVPACEILKEKVQQKALQEITKVEKKRDRLLAKRGNMLIKNLAVGKDFPMRVMAEIVDAACLPELDVRRLAKHYVEMGADIIDVGMVAGESNLNKAENLVRAVKQVVEVPVSIDTFDPAEIKAAIAAGADLVLSGDAGNIEAIAPFAKDVAVVFVPTNQREGYFPEKIANRVSFLEEIIEKAMNLGFSRVLGDLILEPSKVLESMIAFRKFASRNPRIPLFVGVSNVIEMIDADSVGVNALLARISQELGASIMLATEKSEKAKGTVKEEAIASKMMFLAKKRRSVPKDLGLDLLVLKDKRNREERYDKTAEVISPTSAENGQPEQTVLDAKGSFRFALDREDEVIVAIHYPSDDMKRADAVIKGKTGNAVYMKIVEMGLISKLDHAAYLGSELAKAEIALRTGKEYLQDNELFKKQVFYR